jgi:hypothetical protein
VIAATVFAGSCRNSICDSLGFGSVSLLNFGTINITVMESSRDIVTGEVMAIFSFSLFPPKIYPAKMENPWMPL